MMTTAPEPQGTEASCSTIEAAQQLGTSVQTVQRWMDRGYLRGWRTPGGHRRVDVASVRELLERSRAGRSSRPEGGAGPAGVRVMIVDDSDDDLELLSVVARAVLPQAEVVLMTNPFAALMAIGQEPPDLLITDISMAGLDGVEMIRSLLESPRSARVPVIAVSSYQPDEITRRYGTLPEGIKLLQKPVTPTLLRATVAETAPRLPQR